MSGRSAFTRTRKSCEGTGRDPGRRENVVQRSSHHRKVVRRSRDRGCKGHRILRRVLVGGRHLGSSRAISFHERVVTATLAASSRGKRATRLVKRPKLEGTRRRSDIPRKRERRQRGQRLDWFAGAVGRQRPRSELTHAVERRCAGQGGKMAARVQQQSAEAFSSAVKHSVPR